MTVLSIRLTKTATVDNRIDQSDFHINKEILSKVKKPTGASQYTLILCTFFLYCYIDKKRRYSAKRSGKIATFELIYLYIEEF